MLFVQVLGVVQMMDGLVVVQSGLVVVQVVVFVQMWWDLDVQEVGK
jgi:hypothetical protein